MAMILCPECGASISDKAPACPQCGVPAPGEMRVAVTKQAERNEARARALHNAKGTAILLWLPFWGIPYALAPMSEDATVYWILALLVILVPLYIWQRRLFLRRWARKFGATTR